MLIDHFRQRKSTFVVACIPAPVTEYSESGKRLTSFVAEKENNVKGA